jgi:hypothetical protein
VLVSSDEALYLAKRLRCQPCGVRIDLGQGRERKVYVR